MWSLPSGSLLGLITFITAVTRVIELPRKEEVTVSCASAMETSPAIKLFALKYLYEDISLQSSIELFPPLGVMT
jgi:hypothetical protein